MNKRVFFYFHNEKALFSLIYYKFTVQKFEW